MARGGARHDAVELLVDLAVYAPIGLLSLAREHLDELAATGRGRVQQRLTLARFVGEMAVRQGRKEIERRLAGGPAGDVQSPPTAPSDPLAPVVDLDAERQERDATAAADVDAPSRPDASSAAQERVPAALPIEGYESLAASQVVARLGSLAPADLDAIETFERAHRNRRTVLGRIEQLRAGG